LNYDHFCFNIVAPVVEKWDRFSRTILDIPGRCYRVKWHIPGRCYRVKWHIPGKCYRVKWHIPGRCYRVKWHIPGSRCYRVKWQIHYSVQDYFLTLMLASCSIVAYLSKIKCLDLFVLFW
jgi:hypothetical protein